MLDKTISMYESHSDVTGKKANLGKLIHAIKSGKWQTLVEQYRATGDKSIPFPCFTAAGLFTHRRKDGMAEYSGVFILDFDKMDAEAAKIKIQDDPYVQFAFVSRGGSGLAVGIAHQYGAAAHQMVYEDCMSYFYSTYDIEPDTQCVDVSRLRYVSYDPIAIIREGKPYTMQMQDVPEDRESGMGTEYSARENLEWAAKSLESRGIHFIPGNRHNFRFRLATWVNKLGVPVHELKSFLRERYPSEATTESVDWVYREYKSEHGSKAIRRPVRAAKDYVTKYTTQGRSLNQGQANTVSGPAIYRLRDEKELYMKFYDTGIPEIPGLGFSQTFDRYVKVIPGMFTVLVASSNTGKTTFLLNQMVYMAVKFGWKFALFTPEQDAPPEIMGVNVPLKQFLIEVLAAIVVGKPVGKAKEFRRNGVGSPEFIHPMSETEYEAAFNFIDEHFIFLNPQSGDAAFASIMGLAEYCVEAYGVKGIVVDPWNMVEDSLGDYAEVADKFREITKFRKRTGVGWWVSNHISKDGLKMRTATEGDGLSRSIESVPSLYSSKGGTEWNDMADYGIVLFRPKGEQKTLIKIDKIRFQPLCGQIGEFYLILNQANSRFYQEGYPDFTPLIDLQKWI